MLAMEANDDAGCLNQRSAPTCIASKLAPTGWSERRLNRAEMFSTWANRRH
jgi:hypothetical protein